MFTNFCPKCGATDVTLIKALCESCYLKEHELVNISGEATICKKCSRIKIRERWLIGNKKNIYDFIMSRIKVKELNNVSINIKDVGINDYIKGSLAINGSINSHNIGIQKEFKIKIDFCKCPFCSKIAANYHEGVIQLRANKDLEKILKYIKMIIRKNYENDPLSVVVKEIKLPNGYDLLIGSKKATINVVNQLKNEYNAKIKTTATVIGVKSGKELKRVTFSIRL